MLKERLQLMVSVEQRQRLEDEARRRGSSVATVVRDAIDEHIGVPTREDRLEALAQITAMQGRYLAPDRLDAVIGEERVKAALAD